MKKLSLLCLALAFSVSAAIAAPVDVTIARDYGQKFVRNTLGQKAAEITLAYTKTNESGLTSLYVFNFDHGFVMVAADDRAYPILAYSEEGTFDADNMAEGLQYYLGHYERQIQFAVEHNLTAEQEISDQWYLLGKEGVVSKARTNRAVSPLLATTWNQDFPYNYYAPTAGGGPGGHCYAGCLATAMSQVMKFWNWPVTGTGEHSYNTSTYGGTLSVNFGAATYDWANMPTSVSSLNAQAQAIALLMYHCGVAVDMDYKPSGSGAHTDDAPQAVKDYFRYASCTNLKYRDMYSKVEWEDLLMASLDRGIPMIYAGAESDGTGGHAFNCDGYNDQRKFHFNWGWSGNGNNAYYEIDALNIPAYLGGYHFNSYQRVVFDMLPDYIYEATVPAIESLEVGVADALTHTVVVSFTIPTTSVSGAALESIQSIVLERNGEVIQTFANPQPGEEVVYQDEVSEDGCYEYTVYGVNNDWGGDHFSRVALVGPNCTWKVVATTTNFQGWNGGKIQFVGANGVIFKELTMENSTPVSDKFQMPEGEFQLSWKAPSSVVSAMTISLKNSANQQVYNFSGSSSQLSGVLYTGSNDCPDCTPPTDFMGVYRYENGVFGTLLSWHCDYTPSKFKVYRSEDGVDYEEIAAIDNTLNEYFDDAATGMYYYKVTAFSTACESTPATTSEGTDYVYVMVTGVEDHGTDAVVYPNPVKDMLVVNASGLKEVVMYNSLGQPVCRCHAVSDVMEINTAGFGSGVYTVSVLSEDGVSSRRVVVLH